MTEDELFAAYGLPLLGPAKPADRPVVVLVLVLVEVAQGGDDDSGRLTMTDVMTDTTGDDASSTRWWH